MTNLDPRSMIALAGFMSAVMAMVLLFMRRHYPPSIRGVGGWAAAPLLWLLSAVLFGARGAIPDWLGLVLANQLMVLGSVTYYMGTRQFMGQPATWRTWNWVMAGTTVVFAWLTYGWPNYAVRVGFFTVVMGVLYAEQLRFMLRHGGRNFPVRLVEVTLGLHMLVLGVRLGSILAGHAGNDLMEPSLFQTLYIGAYALTVLMLSIGAVLMATDRLRTELEHLATYDSLTQTLNRRALLQRCVFAHRSGERGHALMLKQMQAEPLLDLGLRLGEGSGAALAWPLLQSACAVLREMASFESAGVATQTT